MRRPDMLPSSCLVLAFRLGWTLALAALPARDDGALPSLSGFPACPGSWPGNLSFTFDLCNWIPEPEWNQMKICWAGIKLSTKKPINKIISKGQVKVACFGHRTQNPRLRECCEEGELNPSAVFVCEISRGCGCADLYHLRGHDGPWCNDKWTLAGQADRQRG